MLDESLINREVEILVGDYAGVWGYIRGFLESFGDNEFYVVNLWNNPDCSIFIKDGDFRLVD